MVAWEAKTSINSSLDNLRNLFGKKASAGTLELQIEYGFKIS